MKNSSYNLKEIEEKIRRVDGAMAQEGMPLSKKDKQMLFDCLTGKTTIEKERKRIIDECKAIYKK